MVWSLRRWLLYPAIAFTLITFLYRIDSRRPPLQQFFRTSLLPSKYNWQNVRQHYPVQRFYALPTGPLGPQPRVQHDFPPEPQEQRKISQERQSAVKEAFLHSWEGYKSHAWLHDEVRPVSGRTSNGFGGWGATLVDSLDTLHIMGLDHEFERAVDGLRKLDFTRTTLSELNVFETTIRYLGGFLAAYDLSGYPILLAKARELGDMLYLAFDTPTRMPITLWDWRVALLGEAQEIQKYALLAEVGSLSLEFTRLSQLTKDNKYYDAVLRIMNVLKHNQNQTDLPGLWPIKLDTQKLDFTTDHMYTFGGMADSAYEYLPKQHLLLGGREPSFYRDMYLAAFETANKHLFFRPLNPQNKDMLISGTARQYSGVKLVPEGQHLTCFAGGMVALAAKTFDQPKHLEQARKLVDGCIWAYESFPSGIMPETFMAEPCDINVAHDCTWSEKRWRDAVVSRFNSHYSSKAGVSDAERAEKIIKEARLPPGFLEVNDPRYLLRPEAIESVFILYRITGDESLRDRAWEMFQAINNATRTSLAYAELVDVRDSGDSIRWIDSMESFWTGETLKYLYLIFSEPELISLDEYVFNTEAHPLLLPKH